MDGDTVLAPSVTRRVLEAYVTRRPGGPDRRLARLTVRETEVLCLVAQGLSNAEIADRLVLSVTTVKSHVARLLAKLELRDRVQAVVLAYESGLTGPAQR
jgi:DNA-binding NarL/FixJ family response regulator